MMVAISYRNGVSIAEIVVYVPALSVAAFLAFRHGVFKGGWNFLITFCLARIMGPCFELAGTMNGPPKINLIISAAILQGIGLSPLMMTALAFLSRVITSINRNGQNMVPDTAQLKLVQLVVTVGLILGIVGGIKASDNLEKTGKFVPLVEGKVCVALFIVVYILLALATILTFFMASRANEADERHLLIAVALSLPFLLVRIIYSAISTFDSESLRNFNQVAGSATIWLFMSVIMEIVVVVIFEGVGVTLKKIDQ